MDVTRFVTRLLLLTLAYAAAVALPAPANGGSIVEVTNPDDGVTRTLSDLIAYGAGGLKNTILKLNDPSDDIVMAPGGIKTFDAGFEVTKYFISRSRDGSEGESVMFDVRQLGPKPFGFVLDPNGLQELFASLDYDTAAPPPADGTILAWVDGLTPTLPGWFVGTVADFDAGTVSGPYTGAGRIERGFIVRAVPEPPVFILAVAGALALLGHRSLKRAADSCRASRRRLRCPARGRRCRATPRPPRAG